MFVMMIFSLAHKETNQVMEAATMMKKRRKSSKKQFRFQLKKRATR
jgi:hypothetical protein